MYSYRLMNDSLIRLCNALLLVAGLAWYSDAAAAAESCVDCHEQKEHMEQSGYPQFHFLMTNIARQTKMTASCSQCHLGNPSAAAKKEAHEGLLRVWAVDRKGTAISRDGMPPDALAGWKSIAGRGRERSTLILPKIDAAGRITDNPSYPFMLWHDKNPGTYAFNPGLAGRTCGQCHAETVRGFLKSPMGGGKGAHTQSQYRYWTDKTTGPHSCGLWTAEALEPRQDTFTTERMEYFNSRAGRPISEKTAFENQLRCNKCHVGCLDCHLDGAKGAHSFLKKPSALSCYGGGRSAVCHAGPLERRRGDGYLRAEFTVASPAGAKTLRDRPDVHAGAGIVCVDCHEPNKSTGSHADFRRDVSCSKCHAAVVGKHQRGVHKRLDCSSCHTALIAGYAFNFWSAVGPKGQENTITRIQDYYTDAVPPIILKNPRGIWIPVHVVPHMAGNVRFDDVAISTGLVFRNPPVSDLKRRYFSNDSYAVTGRLRQLDAKDQDVIAWLNIDRVAHAIGKARSCDSCHASRAQTVVVGFSGGSYKDVEDGEYAIIADARGLRIDRMKGTGGETPQGLKPFRGIWDLQGDFSLPPVRKKAAYQAVKQKYDKGAFTH
ncbi:MAG TPA: cytochrome c3 family protein [Dissulfurispiraceae bacterium]|nr:cytochrome c3 family protein [Dissulfurispiraceae bacterium]